MRRQQKQQPPLILTFQELLDLLGSLLAAPHSRSWEKLWITACSFTE